MTQSLIRLHDVQRRTGYSKAWIYHLMSQESSPSVKLVLVPLLLLKVKLMTGSINALLNPARRFPDKEHREFRFCGCLRGVAFNIHRQQ